MVLSEVDGKRTAKEQLRDDPKVSSYVRKPPPPPKKVDYIVYLNHDGYYFTPLRLDI